MGPLVQNDVPLRLDARPVPNVPEPRPVPAQAENASTATAERMHPFTLRFVGALEREFADEYFDQTLGPVRLAAALGFVLYTGLGALDPYVAAAHFQKLWLIRFVIVGPVILACFALTYAPSFRRVHEWVLSATILLAALGLIAMIVIIEEPGNFLYYAGLLLTMMFITLTRLSVPVTLAVTLAIVAVYAAAALFLTQLELRFVVNNLSFLASTMIVSLLANY